MSATEEDFQDRAHASERRLQAIGLKVDKTGLKEALQAEQIAVRAEAAFLTGYRREQSLKSELQEALMDEEARVRVEAAFALIQLGAEGEGLPVLLQELEGEFFQDAPLRAARALAQLDNPAGYPRVLEAASSEFPSTRMEAIFVLPAFFSLTQPEVAGITIDPIALLVTGSADPEEIIRRDALSALANSPDPRAKKAIEAALEDPEAAVRNWAKHLLEISE
jgi:HEAT repeat protein